MNAGNGTRRSPRGRESADATRGVPRVERVTRRWGCGASRRQPRALTRRTLAPRRSGSRIRSGAATATRHAIVALIAIRGHTAARPQPLQDIDGNTARYLGKTAQHDKFRAVLTGKQPENADEIDREFCPRCDQRRDGLKDDARSAN